MNQFVFGCPQCDRDSVIEALAFRRTDDERCIIVARCHKCGKQLEYDIAELLAKLYENVPLPTLRAS